MDDWKDVPGTGGAYQAHRDGRIRSLDRMVEQGNRWGQRMLRFQKGVELTRSLDRHGYVRVTDRGLPTVLAHRIVAMTWIDNPLGLPQVNHRDGDTTNNNVDNLEWMTNSENHTHACHSLGRKPNRSGMKVTRLVKNGVEIGVFSSANEAAQSIGVVKTAIMNAARSGGKCRGHEVSYV